MTHWTRSVALVQSRVRQTALLANLTEDDLRALARGDVQALEQVTARRLARSAGA